MPEFTGHEASHWTGGLQGIQHLIMARPQMAAMARQRALQMQLNQQHGAYYEAQAGLLQQKQKQIAQQMDALNMSMDRRKKIADAAQRAAQGDQSAMKEMHGLLAQVAADNPHNPVSQTLIALGEVPADKKYEADNKLQSSKYATDTNAKTKLEATDKTVAGRLAGIGLSNEAKAKLAKDTAEARQKLEDTRYARSQAAYDTKVEHYDEVKEDEAKPAVPAKPAGTGLFGTGWFASPAVPAKPAIVPHPKYDITTRIPHGSAWSNTQNLPAAPAAPSTGINEGATPTPEPAAPAPTQPAAPAATAQPAPSQDNSVPPPNMRKVGHVVTTTKGTFVWDGAQWHPSQAQSGDQQ